MALTNFQVSKDIDLLPGYTYRIDGVDVALPSQSGNSGKYLKTNGSSASWETVPTNYAEQVTITTNDPTTLSTIVLSSFVGAEYIISLKQGSKTRTSKVIVQTNGTLVEMSEYAIIETGGEIPGVVLDCVSGAGNAILKATVPDASQTNVIATILRVNGEKTTSGIVTIDDTQTLLNKTLTSPIINNPTGITKSDVGLGNVDNTSDANKPVSTAQASAIATAKSEAIADATNQVNAVIASAPAALNTLNELAAALGNDANFASTITNSLTSKASVTGSETLTNKTLTSPVINLGINQQSSSYTLVAGDSSKLIEAASGSITIPPNSSVAFAIGTQIHILQTTSSQITVAAGSGVTLNATPGSKLRAQWSMATLIKRSTDTWVLSGDLIA